MASKQEIMNEVCLHLGGPLLMISTGSTEPKEFLTTIANQLGLEALSKGLDKQGLAKLIVESGGNLWLPEYDSSGGTITREGLIAIRNTVMQLVVKEL